MNALRGAGLAICLALWAPGAMAQGGEDLGPTLSRIKARQALYVAYREDSTPFSFLISGQALPVGYVMDVCGHVLQAAQSRLGVTLPMVPLSVTDNSRIMMLKTGVADLDCGAAANTVARQKQVGFSHNIYVNEIRVMAKKEGGLASLDQLGGKRVVTVTGGAAERQLKLAALGRNVVLQHLLARDPDEAMNLLVQGDADAYAADEATLADQRSAESGDFVLLDGVLAVEPWAIMLPMGDSVWKKLVDDTVLGLMESGELARIYDKWFMQPIRPAGRTLNLPLSPLLKAAIQAPSDKPVN